MGKQKKSKFWDLQAANKEGIAKLYIYGEIVQGDKWDSNDVSISDFTEALSSVEDNAKELNMYVNSPGGSVFTTCAMMAQLERLKSKVTINAYVDGIAASAASFLIMVADNIYMYSTSMLMVHKPMLGFVFNANANKLREQADFLDKIETGTCIPAYLSKGTDYLNEQTISELLAEKDVWLDAKDVAKYFNVNVIEESKDYAACITENWLYDKNSVPKQLLQQQNAPTQMSAEEKSLREKLIAESKANLLYLETVGIK